jgi:hypothetical protein
VLIRGSETRQRDSARGGMPQGARIGLIGRGKAQPSVDEDAQAQCRALVALRELA